MNIFFKFFKALKNKGMFGFLEAAFADVLEVIGKFLVRIRDHYSRYNFVDRSKGESTLVVVLAGYKQYLWCATLTNLHKHQPENVDICIVSSGMYSQALADLCEEHMWSYISVKRNSPGVAINKAIYLHPNADYIYKLDEDIFISSGFFENLKNGYDYSYKYSLLEPGFVAPVLNLNGVSYSVFLREFNLEAAYREKFGNIIIRCGDLPIHNSPETAWWIWQHTLPFEEKAEKLAENQMSYTICNTRFSIGAILFRREFINNIGGFKSDWHSGVLGVDEDELCRDCISLSRPMYIINTVLAGHFSFYPQEQYMKQKLSEMSSLDPITFQIIKI